MSIRRLAIWWDYPWHEPFECGAMDVVNHL